MKRYLVKNIKDLKLAIEQSKEEDVINVDVWKPSPWMNIKDSGMTSVTIHGNKKVKISENASADISYTGENTSRPLRVEAYDSALVRLDYSNTKIIANDQSQIISSIGCRSSLSMSMMDRSTLFSKGSGDIYAYDHSNIVIIARYPESQPKVVASGCSTVWFFQLRQLKDLLP